MELLVVVALITIFLGMTVPFGMNFYRQQIIEEVASEVSVRLKAAQSYSQAGRANSPWGVKFFEREYIMFVGDSFAERNENYDRVFSIPYGAEIPGEIEEVVFELGTGYPIITKKNGE